jgi:multidrug resistance efflux pump
MLLPSEFIRNSIDAYIDKHPTKSQKIYWVALAAVIIAIGALPFIYVDISVRDAGIVRPAAEKTQILSPVTEFVDSIYVSEGKTVKAGDTLLTFRANASEYKINYQQSRLNDIQQHIHDLQYLSKGVKPKTFQSDARRSEYAYYQQQKSEYETNFRKSAKELERNQSLYEKKVIPEEEFDKYSYENEKAKNQLATLDDNQTSKWQTDLNSYLNLYGEMQSNLKLEKKDKDLYVVTSPVGGTIEQFRGIYEGSNIQAGTQLAVISPDSTLFIEVYMSPRNIGYIEHGMPVNVQIESFNYNEWGTMAGTVTDISSDFFADETSGRAYYKVKCNMEKDFLTHRKGMRGNLKKGMTVSAHFMITRKSLFDVLYQKMDDWVNPGQYIETQNMAKM